MHMNSAGANFYKDKFHKPTLRFVIIPIRINLTVL